MEESVVNVLQNLEKAADIILCGSNAVSQEQRQAAESYFMDLRKLKCPYNLCRNILENTSNDFVRYQTTCVIREAVLREWLLVETADIENLWKYLLDYACCRPGLPNFVTGEILMAVSTIIKRGTFDGKSGETDTIFETTSKMIASNDVNLVSLACQILLSLCTEYCTSWRSSDVGITWDFHVRAKRHFENSDLIRILQLALQILHYLMSDETIDCSIFTSAEGLLLVGRILNVTETVLSWNFGSKYLPKRLTYTVEFSPAVSFHPPDTWRPLLLNAEVMQIFFHLHSRLRLNSDLSHHSLQCLVQLASLSGAIFPDESSSDQYLQFFVKHFVDLFQTDPHSFEVVSFAHVVQKLLCFHALAAIRRLPQPCLTQFVALIQRMTCIFCCKAAEENMQNFDDPFYQEAYGKLLDGWSVQLKADNRVSEEQLYSVSAQEIFSCFWRCHLAPPLGVRNSLTDITIEEIEESVEEDREKFFDVLVNLGIVGRYVMEATLTTLTNLWNNTLLNFQLIVEQQQNSTLSVNDTFAVVQNMHEDLHWLLLITGFTLSSEDIENIFFVPLDILHYLSKINKDKKLDFIATRTYLASCLTLASEENYDLSTVDPVMRLIGCVFRWAAIENRLLVANRLNLLSPQVAQTTAWCLRRLLCAYGDSDESALSPRPCIATNVLQAGTELSQILVHFLLEKFFSTISLWCSEIRLTKEVVKTLVCFVETENRADDVAKDSSLLSELGKIQVEQLSSATRKGLLKALVKIATSTDLVEVHQRMYGTVLDPLYIRYNNILKSANSNNSQSISELIDMLDCFCGIAEAVQSRSAKILFNYIGPALESCTSLLSTCKSVQVAVDAVLHLYLSVTQKMALYLADSNDAEKLYQCVLTMLRSYAECNVSKYVRFVNVEEEKASDLLLLLQVLTNLVSQDVFIAVGPQNSANAVSAATVTLLGLEIVMPLMNKDLLKYPSLCVQYFKLIRFAGELYAEKMCSMPSHMKQNILESIKIGLTFDYGMEIVRLSLYLLNSLSTFVCLHTNENALEINEMKTSLASFLRVVFETCLKASAEVDFLNDASLTLFSVICCDQNGYRTFVRQILDSHQDSAVREKLSTAFENLLAGNLNLKEQMWRKEKRLFRDRFETFLNNIQGLLCLM